MDYHSDYTLQRSHFRLQDYVWSSCSTEDFAKFYLETVKVNGKFCLDEQSGLKNDSEV